ncbi:transposase family protein [Nakamurella sp. PAMC28650]|uniref:transposase family protein n=1 Tax=Nakamurella sp. PAMC28650 TaxID=2762325 RepID=UPI00164D9F78|nr:transposase family protein [Nakamurella sp. PAMC28650]QNK82932.1 transposase family protein [Nakamurella sp. PAMC28650]
MAVAGLGSTMVFLQAAAPRVNCQRHGVVVPGARATRAFEDQCAWLAAHTAPSVAAQLMRTSWRHVSAIIEHVVADGLARRDLLGRVSQRLGRCGGMLTE